MEKAIKENEKRLKKFSDGKEWLIAVIWLEFEFIITKIFKNSQNIILKILPKMKLFCQQ